MLISRDYSWVSMKRGGCKFGDSKTRGCPLSKRGAVVSQLVPNLKESVPPPPPGSSPYLSWDVPAVYMTCTVRTRNTFNMTFSYVPISSD